MKKLVGLIILLAAALAILLVAAPKQRDDSHRTHQQVIVPQEDRFTPFALTIRPGDTVQWVNQDSDDHTVVSDDFFNTAGHNGTDVLLPGTLNNGGKPGKFELRFDHPGEFVYYCKFHSHLDQDHQPVAPGPKGGIQDLGGNFGTAMMGVITVLPRGEDKDQSQSITKQ